MADENFLPEVEDLEIHRKNISRVYASTYRTVNPERWERAKQDIPFDDVVSDLYGQSGSKISCPFHGRDSTPSFTFYRSPNDAFCFGCPSGEGYYDSVIFVSRYMGVNRLQALKWLEDKYELPPLADVEDAETYLEEEETEEEASFVTLTYEDLVEPYIIRATTDIQATKDVHRALDYLNLYFKAEHFTAQAEEVRKHHDDPEEAQEAVRELMAQAAVTLAGVLGRSTLTALALKKDLRLGR